MDDINAADREQQLSDVLVACLEAEEAGIELQRDALLTRFPEFHQELERFFDQWNRFERLAAPLREVAQAASASDADLLSQQSTDPSSPVLPRSFGDYELIEEIGRGGMGVVYKARQKSPNRLVALKMLRSADLASKSDVQRFRMEAEAAASLDHPNIVPIYEVGEQDGRLYFSMKLIEHGSLSRQLERFTADLRAAAKLVAVIAQAVHHAHQHGVLHRDLKPANILLDGEARPYVADFGLAKQTHREGSLTDTGAILGSPGYMAPEQIAGQKGSITTASDVYGLGGVLYALLAGRAPFEGTSILEIVDCVRGREPAPPANINHRVDRDLETICLKCLEKEPARRYASAEAVTEDLQRWLDGKPIQARPVRTFARLWRWCRRNPLSAGSISAASIALLSLVVGLTISSFLVWQQQAETRRALAVGTSHTIAALEVVNDMVSRMQDERLCSTPQGQMTRDLFNAKALKLFATVASTAEDFEETRRIAGDCYLHMAGLYHESGRSDLAQESLLKAIDYHERSAAAFPKNVTFQTCVGQAHNLLGQQLWELGRYKEASAQFTIALAAYHRALELAPEDLHGLRYTAWLYVTCADTQLRNSALALERAKKLIALQPERPENYRILGAAMVRSGDGRSAIETLQEALRRDGGHGADWFLLAMAHHQLIGKSKNAGDCFRQGVAWMDKNCWRSLEGRLFRVEASHLLGIKEDFDPAARLMHDPEGNHGRSTDGATRSIDRNE
jgi:serine/threonine protein kinase/Tfp pilus assembly protein PilF